MIRRPARTRSSANLERLESRQLLTAAVSNTEVLAQFNGKNGIATVTDYLKSAPNSELAKYVSLKHSKSLFRNGNTSLVQLRLTTGANAAGAIKLLKKVPGARWASPNYLYGKPKGDAAPTDPNYPSQVEPLKAIQLQPAWDVTTGSSSLVVAVLDDGFDFTHQDLQGVAWTNPGEIAGNNIDDDANGYVDDIHGYDFGSNDADPSPAFDTVYNQTDSHGTQVASGIAAPMNNGVGIAGVAAGVKVMPIRFRGANVVVSSAGIASGIAYAANNGAKILNLSFSFDPYMNDPAFTTATDLAYAKGVLWINSAGNQGVLNPPRTTLDKVLFVDNVDENDVKYIDSNYGSGTDLSAPGVEVVLAAPGNDYYPVTGTSFSSAVTTGVAALIWSAHPTWTRDQVAAQLLGTVDSIDAKNPSFVGQLGVGRVNAFKAVTTATLAAPTVRGLVGIPDGATLDTAPATISLGTFSVLDASTVTASAFELRGAGVDNVFGTTDDKIIPLTVSSVYAYGSNKIDLGTGSAIATGNYRFTAKTTLANPFGTKMAAAFTSTFSVVPAAPATPTGFTVITPSYSKTEAEIKWTDASDNETGFTIERSSTAAFTVIDKTMTGAANTTRYNDWALEQGKTYYYRIRAFNAVGQGVNSPTAVLTVALPPAGIPAAPTAAGLVAVSNTEVTLSWTDNATNETSFTAQRSTSSTFATIDRTFVPVAGSVWYTDWGLMPGTKYYYRIRADNQGQASTWSNTATITMGGGVVTPTVPAAPTTLAATAVTGGKATLTWADKSTNETSFTLERSLFSSFALLTTTKTIAANAITFADTGLSAGLTYYYRLRAVNAVGVSTWTSVVSMKAK